MDIGREIRTYTIEPLRTAPVETPATTPAVPDEQPVEVPA